MKPVKKPRTSITTRLLSYLLIAGLVPLVLLGISAFDISRRIIIEQAGQFHLQQMTNLQAYLSLYAEQIESLAANIAGNEAIGEALRGSPAKPSDTVDAFSTLTTHAQIGYILNSYVRVKGLVSIDLFSFDDKHYHVGDTLNVREVEHSRVQTMLAEARDSKAPVYWRGIEDNLNQASTQKKVLMVTRVVRHFVPQSGTNEVVGLLVINIDANVVVHAFLDSVKTSERLRLMLVDRFGRFFFHTDPLLVGQSAAPGLLEQLRMGEPVQPLRLDGEEVILGVVPDSRFGGILAGALPRTVLTEPVYALIYAGVVLLLIGIAGIGVLVWRFAHHIVAPVRDVSEGFRQLRANPDMLPPALNVPDTKDEMTDMVIGFNHHLDVLASQQTVAQQLLKAQQAAEAANLAKSQFLATMSHEIRTPMNGVLGMAQLLLMPGLSDEERVDFARTILDSGETLLALLNDILDLSKVEAGKLKLEQAPTDPAQIAQDVGHLFGEAIRKKGIQTQSNWRGPQGKFYVCDPVRLRQMLSNLVNNAVKFTEHGEIQIECREISCRGSLCTLEFSVTDSGIGVSDEAKQRLFQPFSQADSSTTRKYGGSGLGLSIVRTLAQLMNGEAGVESAPGQGSRFWFRVEAEAYDHADQSVKTEDLPGPENVVQPSSSHVLVVEDNQTNRLVASTMLGKLGMTVSFAEDGQQAVNAVCQTGSIDLVLMDVQMPVMDGYIATEKIRAWERETGHRRIPIIALTANAYAEDHIRCLAAGMDDYLAKPVDFAQLEKILARHLGSNSS